MIDIILNVIPGSHGAGSYHETVTPLLVWGSGLIKSSIVDDKSFDLDNYGMPNQLYGRFRKDIEQADLCPLMASLLGVPIPVNSVVCT